MRNQPRIVARDRTVHVHANLRGRSAVVVNPQVAHDAGVEGEVVVEAEVSDLGIERAEEDLERPVEVLLPVDQVAAVEVQGRRGPIERHGHVLPDIPLH